MSASSQQVGQVAGIAAAPALFQIVYASESLLCGAPDVVAAEVASLVAQTRRRNREAGITGALLFDGRRFAQVLEGAEAAVTATMGRIAADPRHRAVTLLEQGAARVRSFPRWSMAQAEARGDFDWIGLDRLTAGADGEGQRRARSLFGMMQYWLLSQ